MKSLQSLRNQAIKLAGSLRSSPNIRQVFASQSKALSPSEVLSYDVVPLAPIQNADGSFIFLVDYDGLGDEGL